MDGLTVEELQFLRRSVNTEQWPRRVEQIKATKINRTWGFSSREKKAAALARAEGYAAFRSALAAKLDALIQIAEDAR